MLCKDLLSAKGADLELGRVWDCHKEGLALASDHISSAGVSQSYAVVAAYMFHE